MFDGVDFAAVAVPDQDLGGCAVAFISAEGAGDGGGVAQEAGSGLVPAAEQQLTGAVEARGDAAVVAGEVVEDGPLAGACSDGEVRDGGGSGCRKVPRGPGGYRLG